MIKKSDEKKLKSIESKFYLEALNSKEGFSIEDYGLDRRRLGRALGKILRKYGTWFNTSDRYCFMIVNHMEESGLIKETAGKFVVSDNWRETLQKMFPKENLLGASETTEEKKITTEVVTPTVVVSGAPTVSEPIKIEIGSLKNNYEFYKVLLERMGEDFKTQEELRNLVSELYQENFGEKHSSQFFYNKLRFLHGNKILESIEDEGVVKHLRSKDYKTLLDSKKKFLERDPYKFNSVPNETKPAETPQKKEEKKPSVAPQPVPNKKESMVCVCIDSSDLTKLYKTEVLFDDGHKCVVCLEAIQANLDVLKNIKAEADLKSQIRLWEMLIDQREFYLDEIFKIDRLCGKRV